MQSWDLYSLRLCRTSVTIDDDSHFTGCPDDGKTHAGILHLLKALHEAKVITENLALPENPFDDEAINRGLCHLPQLGSQRRRRFLTVPWKSRGPSPLLYRNDIVRCAVLLLQ
ncbi:hypothetical protein B0H13DRAFT_2353031 [Mycena leptocephala]|nr:hypothetical protein B0H13DRAFT_2353031 [Mycena leptocephala]